MGVGNRPRGEDGGGVLDLGRAHGADTAQQLHRSLHSLYPSKGHPMSLLTAFTFLHVLISLGGIVAGFIAIFGWLRHHSFERWTRVFLVATLATSATGFLFPFVRFLPSHAVGFLSLLILPVAWVARYKYHLAGRARWLFTVTSVTAQYFNVFVLIVQLFQKVPALRALAPTQSERPFAIVQGINLMLFIALGIAVTRKKGSPVVAAPVAQPAR
jgi:hypothetical protein